MRLVDAEKGQARRRLLAGALVLIAAVSIGCGGESEEKTTFQPPASRKAAAAAAKKAKGASSAAAAASSNLPPLPTREFQESDFVESDLSRDPFRSYENMFAKQSKTRAQLQRQVLVERYALDELKLAGVVTGGSPRALLVDPTGLGWIVQVGDFVGKAELVHSGGATSADVAVNWRADRIREGDIVFIREDPSHPEIPATTRVMALRPPENGNVAGGR